MVGLNAVTFSNPLAAWDHIKKGGVSVVVSDWNMPGMTGMNLLFKTRSLIRPPHVIIVTAYGTVERVGSSTPIRVDFRLVCATHHNMNAAIATGTFREDLFYRINVVPIKIPPLRERREDIRALALHFFNALRQPISTCPKEISNEVFILLEAFHWPGNVRQLRNAMEYALALCRTQIVHPEDIPEGIRELASPAGQAPAIASTAVQSPATREGSGLKQSVEAAEADVIRATLERHHWRVTDVAKNLKISRSSLYERMKYFGIERPK